MRRRDAGVAPRRAAEPRRRRRAPRDVSRRRGRLVHVPAARPLHRQGGGGGAGAERWIAVSIGSSVPNQFTGVVAPSLIENA